MPPFLPPLLHRAIVAVPGAHYESYAERVVFFEVPLRANPARHLEQLLAVLWHQDTTGWAEDGAIYNIDNAGELAKSGGAGQADEDGLYLLEVGSGKEGIGPHRVYYARADHVDLYVSPRLATRLQGALAMTEALYAQQAGTDVLARLAKNAADKG